MASRTSLTVKKVHERTPFINIRNPSDYFAGSLGVGGASSQPTRTRNFDSGLRGYGSRHIEDNAPFTLWDEEKHDFRTPGTCEFDWIKKQYGATELLCVWPLLVIYTETPPNPVPITVGCVAVMFVPPGYEYKHLNGNSTYASPRVPDPISTFKLARWVKPTKDQIGEIMKALCSIADVQAVNFYSPYIFVELRYTNQKYDKHSLPGRVAGVMTLYHHSREPFWKSMANHARTRLINPTIGHLVHDDTNYLSLTGNMSPGVRLQSSPTTTEEQYATSSASTTAGVLLRNVSGQVRMTGANHGFLLSKEVFHPSEKGTRIGEIDERWVAHDIALIKLDPSINFTNNEYFEAQAPRRLMRSTELSPGSWFSVDGMSTGIVFLQYRGPRVIAPPRFPNLNIEYSEYSEESVLYAHGPTGGVAGDGVCGAPIVEEDAETAGVAGFFHLANSEHCLCAVLDELIDQSWSLA